MPNIRIVVEYNGSYFHGWQVQKTGLETVQGELQRVLSIVLHENIYHVQGSGRTDAGVHARGQVANFFCSKAPDPHILKRAIGSMLRPKLALRSLEIVPDSFHAQRSARKKQYSYRVWTEKTPPILEYGQVWHFPLFLDIPRMQAAAKELVGTHDFTSVRATNCSAPSAIKTLLESELTVERNILVYRVVGTGFLKYMVRNIVGTLVMLGHGKLGDVSMGEILAARDRGAAGSTAPAQGLCLDWVHYDEDEQVEEACE